MSSARRDFWQAIGMGLLIVAFALLVLWLKVAGLLLALAILGALIVLMQRYDTTPEVASLRASLAIARDDIAETLALYDDLLTGMSAEAIADRTLHVPALADRGTTNPVIQDFHLRADAARRFLQRVDGLLASNDLDRPQLERLIAVADERADNLAASWQDARRAAREIGPG
ncbi:hypothetical protein [Corynebacterium sanguinis]|uniref:hypothetical protein n=1 Tax=Corynebacterium sanguinis TaxID=2594913 RepID=UPI00223B47BD|nr:hypothetical protein [Corynebacterium sanguinis]MCT1612949.1 hypothetical protein [Corynebacterium sanguinis]MCT1805133.1 hypothetical protein [Corynebacterium sanguinis]MCT2158238.1 hypothetical protein [Corynebacterium sanguinis]